MKHNHSTTVSNTDEVFGTFIGCTVQGLVKAISNYGQLIRILVFDCGWGLAIHSNGTYWTVHPNEVGRYIRLAREKLEATQRELEHILVLSGQEKS